MRKREGRERERERERDDSDGRVEYQPASRTHSRTYAPIALKEAHKPNKHILQ